MYDPQYVQSEQKLDNYLPSNIFLISEKRGQKRLAIFPFNWDLIIHKQRKKKKE